jgi:hypothetical protein
MEGSTPERESMLKRLMRQAEEKPVLAGFGVLLIVFGLLSAEYHRYIGAIAWHCARNYAEIAGHRVRLPLLWWKEEDTNAYDTSLLVRACRGCTILEPQVVVSPMVKGEVHSTDQEVLNFTQAIISAEIHNSTVKTSPSLVVLKPKAFTLYCARLDLAPFGRRVSSSLFCRAARIPYSISYQGSPTWEREVESILSTLE